MKPTKVQMAVLQRANSHAKGIALALNQAEEVAMFELQSAGMGAVYGTPFGGTLFLIKSEGRSAIAKDKL